MTRKWAAIILICLIGGLTSGALMIEQIFAQPELARKIGAWWSGAQYLGSEGLDLQHFSNDCGPTALKIVCDHYGISATSDSLSRKMKMVRQGVTLRQLQKAAKEMGLSCDARPVTLAELSSAKAPAIVLLRKGHFAVVDRTDSNGFVYTKDPSLGKLKYSAKAFGRAWTGLALIFYDKRAKPIE